MQQAIEDLFNEQKRRLLLKYSEESVRTVWLQLEDKCLLPENIDNKIAIELARVSQLRYEENIGSNRLEGFGWSSAHIKDHMKRFLQGLIKESSAVMKQIH